MEGIDIGILVQAGAVGISVALILLIGYMIKNIVGLFKNHIQANTETMAELRESIIELKTWLKTQNGRK